MDEKTTTADYPTGATDALDKPRSPKYRTLQRYRGGTNLERTMYMERNSMLTQKHFAVSVEQVSIFLTQDNTVISFFEHSADDIEVPILRRLTTPDTILRQSADASMMVQAIIDAIIDLAIPVTAAYEDILSELEVDVLTDPEVQHSRLLYILSSELSTLRSNMQPIANVISALRDHRTDPGGKLPPVSKFPTLTPHSNFPRCQRAERQANRLKNKHLPDRSDLFRRRRRPLFNDHWPS